MYGTGTRSYNRSTEARQMKQEVADMKAKVELGGTCVAATDGSGIEKFSDLRVPQLSLPSRARGAPETARGVRLATMASARAGHRRNLAKGDMKLKRNQRCPIHGKYSGCCGRVARTESVYKSKWETVRPGVRRIRDEYADHPDGYRYRLSKAEMEKVLVKKVAVQKGLCSICFEPLTDMNDVAPDHILPKGMGGARRDDRPENIGAAHSFCNQRKGSQRNYVHRAVTNHD